MKKKRLVFDFDSYINEEKTFQYVSYEIENSSTIRSFIRRKILNQSKKDLTTSRYRIHFESTIQKWLERGVFDEPIAGIKSEHLKSILGKEVPKISFYYDRERTFMHNPKMMTKWLDPSLVAKPRFVIWSENNSGESESVLDFVNTTPLFTENLRNIIIDDIEFYTKKRLSREEFIRIPILSGEMYDYMSSLGNVYYYVVLRNGDGSLPDQFLEKSSKKASSRYITDGFYHEGLLNHRKSKNRKKRK